MNSISQALRQAVLQAAIQGKLTKQLLEDGNATDLLNQISAEKNQLIRDGKIKKEKPLPEIRTEEVPFDIPENWRWVRMSDVIDIRDGTHETPSYVPFGYPLITGKDFYNGYFSLEKTQYISEADYIDINKRSKVDISDILFSMIGGNIGSMIYISKDNFFPMAIKNVALFKQYDYKLDLSRYLFIFLKGHVNDFQSKSKGGAQSFVSLKFLREYLMPLPPLAEQQRIVARVEELMARIDDLEKTETELEILKAAFPGDMKAALLQAAMQGKLTEQLPEDGDAANLINQIVKEKSQLIKKGKIKTEKPLPEISADEVPFDVPENWRWSILGDIAEMYTGNSISETEKAKKYTGLDKGYDYIGTKDIGFDGTIKYDNGVKIPFDSDKFRNAYPDATLLCIEGGSAGRKIAMLNKKVCFGNKLCMFYSDLINKKYLYYYLQSPDFLDAFKNNVSGIIGGVSIKKLKSMLIPVPPLAEQKRIVEKLDKLLPLCDGLVEE